MHNLAWRSKKLRNKNGGQIRVIEAFLAVIIVFSAFTLSTNLSTSQNKTDRSDLTSVGLQTLMKLDSDGSLGRYITDGNWTAIRGALEVALPAGISFNLTAYNEHMQPVNTGTILNAGFSGKRTSFIEYVCVDQGLIFHTYIVHLELARAT
jgi:hypothetical protein